MFMFFFLIWTRDLGLLECQSNALHIVEYAAPTLETITGIVCPADRPAICLPYGACCKVSEFCHSGLCESCFPLNVPEESRLEWCRHTGVTNVTSMRHHTCRLACQDVFSETLLSVCPKTHEDNKVDVVTQADSRHDHGCARISRDSCSALWTTFTVTGVLICCFATLAVVCFRRRQIMINLRNEENKSANQDVRDVISRVEQVTSALKCENRSDQFDRENIKDLVQSLHNQLTELSQVLKRWSQSRDSVTTLSAMAVLESSNISTALSKDVLLSRQKQLNGFV
ncbi:unnamed protein product [Lymnaea stagnalis]|uniref:Uncharacterized protein n=1 Tax=Lymnaea stagnalis TaxID=6523 RepID=A0AAV2HK19_LYMST